MKATYSTKLESGQWLHNDIVGSERTSVRRYWAEKIELGGLRTVESDRATGPYTNWGFTNRLDFVLAQARERATS